MKKILIVIIIIFFILLSNVSHGCLSLNITLNETEISYLNKEKYIFLNDDIIHVGGSGYYNFSSINDAIKESKDGDTIFIWDDSSPYYENVIVDKSITIIGENINSTIIDGSGVGDVVDIIVDHVNILNLTIKNSGRNFIDAGIKIRSDHNNISGNKIMINEHGIYSYNLDDSCFFNNIIIENYAHGIFLPFSSNNTIIRNYIENNKQNGIYFYDSSAYKVNGSIISQNIIKNNNCGIFFWYSFNSNISLNTIKNNLRGISLNHHSNYNRIYLNSIEDNIIYGLKLNYSSQNIVLKNCFTNNNYGLSLIYSSNNEIKFNNYSNHQYGLSLNYSNDNNIYGNYIINDHFGIFLFGSSYNIFELNNIYLPDYHDIGIYLKMNSNFNKIISNNFFCNFLNAFFNQSFMNDWKDNFWQNRNGESPLVIHGVIYIFSKIVKIYWYNYDFTPSDKPYMI